MGFGLDGDGGFGFWVLSLELKEWRAVVLGEEREHLFDLNDLFRGAAEEAEEGFAEGLAEDAQAGEGGETLREMGVAAPGERVGEGARVAFEIKITDECSLRESGGDGGGG